MTDNEKMRLQTLAKRFVAQYRIMWDVALTASTWANSTTDPDMAAQHRRTAIEHQHYAINCHWAHDQIYELFGKQLGEKPVLVPPEMMSESNRNILLGGQRP